MEGIFSMLFVGYERLSPLYREMAITLCGGILNNLYEIQLGNLERENLIAVEKQSANKEIISVPMIYAATESEIVNPELIEREVPPK